MKYLIFGFLLLALVPNLQAQNQVGNGGDTVASEFNAIARTALYFLKKSNQPEKLKDFLDTIESKVNSTLLESVPQGLILNNREVDAVNFPSEGKILISRPRWELIRLRNPSERSQIVLHEYIWIAGYNDHNYALSQGLVKTIEKELNENSESTERYQLALGDFYIDILSFRSDILDDFVVPPNWLARLCLAAGSFKVHMDKIDQMTVQNQFWFSETQISDVRKSVEKLNYFAGVEKADCETEKKVAPHVQMDRINTAAEAIKYLIRLTQFPESFQSVYNLFSN